MRKIICVVRDDVAEYIVVDDDMIRTVATVSLHTVWDYDTAYLVKLFDGLEDLLRVSMAPVPQMTEPALRFKITEEDVRGVIYQAGQQGITVVQIANTIWTDHEPSGSPTPKWVTDAVRNRVTAHDKRSETEPASWRYGERQPGDHSRARRLYPLSNEPQLPFESAQ